MILYIKYMVSRRCKIMVTTELDKLGLRYGIVELGMVELLQEISPVQRQTLHINLIQSGLELLDDKRSILIEKIKGVIIEMVHHSNDVPIVNNSEYISEKLQYDYTYLANVFSEQQGITIQQFIIVHKIEKVKELLLYNELSLTAIAQKMHYSSVGHLSRQFKKITGYTPSHFKLLKQVRSQSLENL